MSLLSLEEARRRVLSTTLAAAAIEVPLPEAHRHFLASGVRSMRAVPPCDNSAMDGYAVVSRDTQGANRDHPVKLAIVETVYAGSRPRAKVSRGSAARIFTGAAVPEGADCVIRQEATEAEGAYVRVYAEEVPGANIRRRGEEIPEHGELLPKGAWINAYALGVLASAGIASVEVHPKPSVAILTVGDELRFPGEGTDDAQIFNSNQFALAALSVEAGATVLSKSWAPDRASAIEQRLREVEGKTDAVISSGGASVGDHDEVKAVLRKMGAEFLIDGVALKPGKPAGYAVRGGSRFFVLPGNPGAAAVAFDQLVRPFLFKRQGVLEQRQRIRAQIDSAQRKQAGLTYLVSATLEKTPEGVWARLRPRGAGQLLQNVSAEGWAVLPPGRGEFEEGAMVEVELFANPRFSPTE